MDKSDVDLKQTMPTPVNQVGIINKIAVKKDSSFTKN